MDHRLLSFDTALSIVLSEIIENDFLDPPSKKSIIDLIESSRQAYLRFHAGRPSRFQNAELKGRNRRRGSDCCASYGSPRVHHCGVPMAHAVCCASCPFLKYLGPANSGRSGGTGSSHLTVVCSKGREGGIPWQGEAK